MDDQKNVMLAMLLSGLVLFAYIFFISNPAQEAARAQAAAEAAAQAATITGPGTGIATGPEIPVIQDRGALISSDKQTGGRIAIDTPALSGSFSLTGSRFDDLALKEFDKTLAPEDGKVIMFTPEGAQHAAYVFDNWVRPEGGTGSSAAWSKVSGETLTPTTPVVIAHQGDGFNVLRTITIDDHFLITLSDVVTNESGRELAVSRKGVSRQHGLPDDLTNFFIIQEGPIAWIDGGLKKMKYKKLAKKGTQSWSGKGGWTGLTDKYWLAAAFAPKDQPITATFIMRNYNGADVYEADYATTATTLSPGASLNSVGHIYAGAKKQDLIAAYMEAGTVERLDMAIDWGVLSPLTRPMVWALSFFGKLVGNFGVGILIITLLLKLILFPLNNKAYASQAKMKAVQEPVKRLQAIYKDDRMKLQQEMMALYKKEGVNPVGGCLPMIPQIFIFFALYKSLFINIDMRHAPFFGWIKDLSARDPLSILNGFGALPWDPIPIAFISFLAIGPLALLYGATMAAMQTLAPAAGTDPMQKRIFQLMPIFFMFILAPFAAGRLVYWVWNNILSFIQQYIITRKFGVETPFDSFFAKLLGKKKVDAE